MANFLSKLKLNGDVIVNLQDESAQASILNINENVLSLTEKIGNLQNLKTQNKNTLVSAINETFDLALNPSIYNVKHYGAIGDGETNDTEAFMRVANLVNEHGGVFYIPTGSYVITDTINLHHTGIKVCGDNMQASFILQDSNKHGIVFGNGEDPKIINCKIEDLGIVNRATNISPATTGVFFNYCVNCLMNNVVIGDFSVGVKLDHTGNTFITNTGIVSTRNSAIGFYGGNQSVSISYNNVYVGFSDASVDNGIGLYVADGNIADFNVNYLDVGNGAYGVFIDGQHAPAEYPPADIRLHEIVVDGSRTACIKIVNINAQGNVLIDGGWLNPLKREGNNCINIINCNNINISNVTMQQLADEQPMCYGIACGTTTRLNIHNCNFINMLGAISIDTVDRVIINSNMIDLYANRSSNSAAFALSNCYNSVINSNAIFGAYSYGIYYPSGDYGIVTSNRIYGATTPKSVVLTNSVDENNL